MRYQKEINQILEAAREKNLDLPGLLKLVKEYNPNPVKPKEVVKPSIKNTSRPKKTVKSKSSLEK